MAYATYSMIRKTSIAVIGPSIFPYSRRSSTNVFRSHMPLSITKNIFIIIMLQEAKDKVITAALLKMLVNITLSLIVNLVFIIESFYYKHLICFFIIANLNLSLPTLCQFFKKNNIVIVKFN
jgi:hypothetical protein